LVTTLLDSNSTDITNQNLETWWSRKLHDSLMV